MNEVTTLMENQNELVLIEQETINEPILIDQQADNLVIHAKESSLPMIYLSYDEKELKYHNQIEDIIGNLVKKGTNFQFFSRQKQLKVSEDEERNSGLEEIKNGVPSFDDSIPDEVISAMNKSSVVVMFITKSYSDRVNSTNPFDCCRYEFINTLRKKKMLLLVVIDPTMINQNDWEDRFGAGLLDFLCFDFTKKEFYKNQLVFKSKCTTIYNCIEKLHESPTNNSTNNSNTTSLAQQNNEILKEMFSSSLESSELCFYHPQHRYQLFDRNCQLPICLLCYSTTHCGHSCESIDSYAERLLQTQKKNFQSYCQETSNYIKKILKGIKDISTTKESILKKKSIVSGEMNQIISFLQEQLQKQHEKLENELNEEVNTKLLKLNEQEASLLTMKKELGKKLSEFEIVYSSCSTSTTDDEVQSIERLIASNNNSLEKKFDENKNDENSEDENRKDEKVPLPAVRFVVAYQKLEKEAINIKQHNAPYPADISLNVQDQLKTQIFPKEKTNLIHSIQQLGSIEDLHQSLSNHLQQHQIILQKIQSFLQLPFLTIQIPYQANLSALVNSRLKLTERIQSKKSWINEKQDIKRLNEKWESLKKNNVLIHCDESEDEEDDDDDDEEEMNEMEDQKDLNLFEFNQYFLVNYCQELLNWLENEFQDENYRYVLHLLLNRSRLITISPLSAEEISNTIANSEVLLLTSPHTSNHFTNAIHFSSIPSRELAIRYKKFLPRLQLPESIPTSSFASSLPKYLFHSSKILYENEMIISLLNMMKDNHYSELHGPLKLLYQGSKDGMTVKDFQSKVYHHGKILIVMKSLDGLIFGGFTSVGWKGNSMPPQSNKVYSYDAKAFLFSLKNPFNLPPVKLPIAQPQYALQERPGYALFFGGDRSISSNKTNSPLSPSSPSPRQLRTPPNPPPPAHSNFYPPSSSAVLSMGSFVSSNSEHCYDGDMYIDPNFLVHFHQFHAFYDPTGKNHFLFTGKYTGTSLVELEVWQIE